MKKSTKVLALCFSAAAIAAAAGIIYLNTKDTGKKIACIYEDGNLVGGFWMGKITFETEDLYYTPAVFIDYWDGRIGYGGDIPIPSIGLNVRPVKDKPAEKQ